MCTLGNVLYILNSTENLFPVGAVSSKKSEVIFNKIEKEVQQYYSALINLALLWHARLGQINFHSLKEMADKGEIHATNINSIDAYSVEVVYSGNHNEKPRQFIMLPNRNQENKVIPMYFILFKDE